MSGPSVENRQTAAGIWAKSGYSKRNEPSETRKLAAILVTDVVGYSRLAGADEDRTLARLRGLRSDLIDRPSPPITAASSSAPATEDRRVPQRGRRRAFRHRGTKRPHRAQRRPPRQPLHRVSRRHPRRRRRRGERWRPDGRRRQIAARLEGVAKPGAICLSEDAYVRSSRASISRSAISARLNSRTSPSRSTSIR